MQDLAFGRLVRMLRIRRGWRQDDLCRRAGISRSKGSRIERGLLTEVSLGDLRALAAELDVRIEVLPRGRGAEVDRIVNARHSEMHEVVAQMFRGLPGWLAAPEVSFSVWGERGVIDILAWHPTRRALLVIELKTELVDPAGLVATVDRYRRLAPAIAAERGWKDPASVSCWVVIALSRSNERGVARHATMLRAAFPNDGRRIRGWLRRPTSPIAVLSFLRVPNRELAPRSRASPPVPQRPGSPPDRRAGERSAGRNRGESAV